MVIPKNGRMLIQRTLMAAVWLSLVVGILTAVIVDAGLSSPVVGICFATAALAYSTYALIWIAYE